MRAALIATLLAGCVTDPNGDTCAWRPGSDGFCPSDDGGGSSGPKYIETDYRGPTGAPFAGHVRVAMTRTRTEEPPQLETALVGPSTQPVHAPVLVDGEPLVDAERPQLAAIGQRTYLVWTDREDYQQRGALLTSSGSIIRPITELGPGELHVVGERFVVVHPADRSGLVRASWIAVDGQLVDTTDVTAGLDDPDLLDASGGDRFLAVATTSTSGALVISRVAPDGAIIDRIPIALTGKVLEGQIVPTIDGGVFGQFKVTTDDGVAMQLVIVDADATVAVMPSPLPPFEDLVRVPLGIVATTYHPPSLHLLDDTGLEVGAPFSLANRAFVDVVPMPGGFSLVHKGPNAAIAVTPMPGGTPTPSIDVAYRSKEEAGCGCQSASPGSSAVFALALLGILRRRRMLARCKSPSSAPG